MTRFYFFSFLLFLSGSVLSQPVVNLGNDTLICDQRYWELDAGNPGADYKWSTDERTQTITIYESGTYYVTVNDGTGITTDEIEVTILNEKYNQTNHWIFGNGGHIEFNKHSNVAGAQNSSANIPAGSSVATDEDGSLLFYSEGQNIYDKDGNIMANGDNIYGNNSLPSTSMIFPKPGSTVYYYVFTIDETWGLHYSVVDITANGGKGEVIEKNDLTDRHASMMTAVKPGDGNVVWLYVLDRASNTFRSFKVERNSVTEAFISNTGPVITEPRHIKVSVYGDRLAVTDPAGVHFYDVDTETGEIEYVKSVPIENATGVEFSRGNNYAYVSTGEKGEIYQVHLGLYNSSTVNYQQIYAPPADGAYNFGDIQLGIDGNIYVASKDKNCIGKIENGNTTADFNPEGFCLAPGATSLLELPDFPQHYFKFPQGMGLRWQDTCQGEKQIISAVSYLDEKPYAQIRYNIDLGDGTVIDTNYIEYAYQQPGVYTIKLTLTSVCHTQEREVPVYIEERPDPQLPDTVSVCANDTLVLDPMTADSLIYLWDTGDTTKTYNPVASGLYAVTIKSDYCTVRDSTQANFIPIPQTGLPEWNFICEEKGETLTLQSLEGHTFLWSPSRDTSRSITIDTAGVYYLFIIGKNSCTNEDSIKIDNMCEAEIYAPDVFTPNGDGSNDSFQPKGKYLLSYELRIYNRWGEVVFVSNDPDEGWDGYYRGIPAQQGAYGFVILYESITRYPKNLKRELKGHLMLVR